MGRKNSKSKRVRRWTQHKISSSKSRSTSTSPSQPNEESQRGSKSQQDASESDIPGYYFDPEKKTYFKILPNHLGCGGSYVTKDTIKRKNDRKRLHYEKPGTTSSFSALLSSYSGQRRQKRNNRCSIMDSVNHAQMGQISRKVFENCVRHRMYSKINPNSHWGVSNVVLPSFGVHLEALQRMELNSRCDKAVCVWSVEMDMSQKIQLMSISYNNKSKIWSEDNGCFPVKIQASPSFGVTCSSKISSLCWCPLSSLPGKSCVLYTTIFPLGDFDSKVSISNLQAKEKEDVNIFDFSLGRGAVWSSAWNQANNRFSVGCERKCKVIDVHARRQWVYSTDNSDALAQLFSLKNPHLLYNGTRSGAILIQDLRNTNHSPSFTKLNQKMAVVCLRSPEDENYIYASDFSGLICLWDLRKQKIVMKYKGLVNSHYQLPFYLDDTEQFIYATGSDGYCKLWDHKTGEVVTSITPPIRDIRSDCLPMFPISHFSSQWTGHDGIIGVITGMGRKFFLSH